MNLPRPGKKKAYVLAKAAEKGRLTAQVEHEYKDVKFIADMLPFLPEKYKKNAVLWIKGMIEKNISKIPKGIAILGMTIIIKGLIDTSQEIREKLSIIHKVPWFYKIAVPILYQAEIMLTTTEKIPEVPEWTEWLVAFTIAYIVVEHGREILKGVDKLSTMVLALLG